MNFTAGTPIKTPEGYLGQIVDVVTQVSDNRALYVLVQHTGDTQRWFVPVDLLQKSSDAKEWYLPLGSEVLAGQLLTVGTSQAQLRTAPTTLVTQTENALEARMPIFEERLRVAKQEVELGAALIHKTVEHFQDRQVLPLTRDDLQIERVPINKPLEAALEPRYEGDCLIIPIMEEVLVVKKQLVLTEEVRIRKRQLTEQREVHENLQRERVTIENYEPTVNGGQPTL